MSKIEWTDEVWNPVTGCTRVSAGCDNCYAVRMTKRLQNMPDTAAKYTGLVNHGKDHFNGVVRCHEEVLLKPLSWRKPKRVFVNSMSDLFHKDVPFEFIDKVFAVMALTPHITYQILTKRPERMAEYFRPIGGVTRRDIVAVASARISNQRRIGFPKWPLFNVWLGTSVENQEAADQRIPHLLRGPAAVRFLSVEPMLGPVNVFSHGCPHPIQTPIGERLGPGSIEWVICGGESGPNARPMESWWAQNLRDQCVNSSTPFFFKQWGEFIPAGLYQGGPTGSFPVRLDEISVVNGYRCVRVGKKAAGRLLDGRTWDEFPEVAK